MSDWKESEFKFRKFGNYHPTDFEKPEEVKPYEHGRKGPLYRLDYLLRFLKETKPDVISEFTQKLTVEYEQLIEVDFIKKREIEISDFLDELQHLAEYENLAKLLLNFYFGELNLPEDRNWAEDTIEVTMRSWLRANLRPHYNNLHTMIEVMDRTEAIELFKDYTNKRIKEVVAMMKDKFEMLQDLADSFDSWDPDNPVFAGLISEARDGKLIFRKDKCHWAEALNDLHDSEIKYYVCCYGDFESDKSWNKDFVLTMEHTIAAGDPFCDCVIHDTRIIEEVNHPPREFFERITPEEDV